MNTRSTQSRDALIFGLARLADSRDPETGGHLERICNFSAILASELQRKGLYPEIDDHWIHDLRLAAALHDIGKVGIPDRVLRKPGPLTPDERAEIERHPQIAADTLLAIYQRMGGDRLIALSVQVALYHHEKWDGSGYPFRLKSDEIPLAARIVAVSDVYDALTSKRVYKDAITHEEAWDFIKHNAGTHFDANVVDAFNSVSEDFRAIRQGAVEQSDQILAGLLG